MSQEQANKDAVEKVAAAWKDGTGSIFDIVSKDVVWTVVGSGESGRTLSTHQFERWSLTG